MIYAALDTNIFLHFKALAFLSWKTIADGPLTVVVTQTVNEELDKKKWESDRRLNSRARSALSQIDRAESGRAEYSGPPLIVLSRQPLSIYEAHGLQRESADHRIIGELLAFQNTLAPTDALILVTADSNMRRQATSFGLRVVHLPEADEIPAEPDPRDAKLKKLNEQVLRYETAIPKVRPFIANRDSSGKAVRFAGPIEDRCDESAIDERVSSAEVHHAYPKHGDQTKPEEWVKYEAEWAEYLKEYRDYCVEQWRHDNRTFELTFGITNVGPVAAASIDLFVHFPDGFELMREKQYSAPKMPSPPSRPVSPFESLAQMARYFEGGGKGAGFLTFSVPEYRPKPLDMSLIDIRKTDSYEVALPLMRGLKQSLTYRWEPLILRYDDACAPTSFVANYRLVVANAHGVESGTFKIRFGPTPRGSRSSTT